MIQDQLSKEKPDVYTDGYEDEIDLMAIVNTIWSGRKTLFISIGICIIIGLFVAISSPKEFTVSTVMVPQTSGDMGKSQLSGLASLAGVNLGMTQSVDLSPIIYPKIVNSTPFKLELMNTAIHLEKMDKPISLFEYYTTKRKPTVISNLKKYTIGLPGVILGAINTPKKEILLDPNLKSEPIQLSIKQYKVKRILDQIISLEVDKKEGYLTLIVQMPEALAAAEVAQKAQELLQREIIKFKVEKSRADLDFIQERFNVAKAEAEKYQVNVAVNSDRFKNLTSSLPQVSNARIQTKFAIANSVYQDLAKQLEQSKIQVKKETPVFTIIEPIVIPSESSKPNRLMILFNWFFMGTIAGISIILGKNYISKNRQKQKVE